MADPLHDALVIIYEYAKNGDERSTDGRDTSLVNIGRVARLSIKNQSRKKSSQQKDV